MRWGGMAISKEMVSIHLSHIFSDFDGFFGHTNKSDQPHFKAQNTELNLWPIPSIVLHNNKLNENSRFFFLLVSL